MLDFLMFSEKDTKQGKTIYPSFKAHKSSDLMIRGHDFYAIWVEDKKLWSTNEYDAIYIIDRELDKYVAKYLEEHPYLKEIPLRVEHLWDAENKRIDEWKHFCQKQMPDNFTPLDQTIIFSNYDHKKENYASHMLDYPLAEGSIASYDKLMNVLYSEEERRKIEWAIGSIVTGATKDIQKFIVLYGSHGTGKSTVLNIIQKIFKGYYAVFDAQALGSSTNSFALEAFKRNPLVAIQHDGDLSRLESNTRLNSLVSHEEMLVNEKHRSLYTSSFKCFMFMGTNNPVKITDAKSGLLRRLIDVSPTGNKIPYEEYVRLTNNVEFELGAIAYHCKEVFLEDPNRYDSYVPTSMMSASNDFFNFMMDNYFIFQKAKNTTADVAWTMYKEYCEDAKVPHPLSKRPFKEELKNYYEDYKANYTLPDGSRVSSYYIDFKESKFSLQVPEKKIEKPVQTTWLEFKKEDSLIDDLYSDCKAQYATEAGTPLAAWDGVKTTLKDIDSKKLHYVQIPESHIVIDFDIPDDTGSKCLEKNLEAASQWPETYAELSKSGKGIHLHYIYAGDTAKLSAIYAPHIEVKVFKGNSSLRRMLTKCNDIPVANISGGLPLKGEKMVSEKTIQDERNLVALIQKALRKEIPPGATKTSIDFIYMILEQAQEKGIKYDVSSYIPDILDFAAHSSNQKDYCLKMASRMKFKSEEESKPEEPKDDSIYFFDTEVFPNLFVLCYKKRGAKGCVRLINPTPEEIEALTHLRLVGFNNLEYDNHICYARILGYTNEQLYHLSKRLVSSSSEARTAKFREAKNLSYTDIYDFAATKQSLKKWELALKIHHKELGLDWDKPVPEELWDRVADYCCNDVDATEETFEHLSGDFTAREILADLAGMTVNDTTNSLTTKIIFGNERHPKLVYTNLATGEQTAEATEPSKYPNKFEGYHFGTWKDYYAKYPEYIPKDEKIRAKQFADSSTHNLYLGKDMGFGGYVDALWGLWLNVALLDVMSLHPHSAIAMNVFAEATKNFEMLLDIRIHIKHKEYDKVRELFDGKLAKYLDDPKMAKALSKALKIAINSVYGLTSATFPNAFRDPRNVNNIVALRGALFMRLLQNQVEALGYKVVHIKTDSIKIADSDPSIIEFCMEFAKEYGYTFEHEATYERMCLVNNAVYIARYATPEWCKETYGYIPEDNNPENWENPNCRGWTATGTQFQVPYVFKTLFSHEPVEPDDMCEVKSSKTAIYLDMNEDLPDDEHNYIFVGKVGCFCPVKKGCHGGTLYSIKDGKYNAVSGSKGYHWKEAETLDILEKKDQIDETYYISLCNDAIEAIEKYGDFEWFVSDPVETVSICESAVAPWDETTAFDVR